MPSILSHPAVPLALFPIVRHRPDAPRLLLIGVAASILPDADTLGFRFGVHYGDLVGHRGLTHSLLFAANRYFLPWRPILVSPIGVDAFLTARGARVVLSELMWMWFPAGALAVVASFLAQSYSDPYAETREPGRQANRPT